LVIDDAVCGSCNNRFSIIDQNLVERSPLSLVRIAFASKKARLGGDHFWLERHSGLWLDIQIQEGLTPFLPSQLHENEEGALFFGSERGSATRFWDLLRTLHSKEPISRTFIKEGPEEFVAAPRIVEHRRTGVFVRALNQDQGKRFLDRLERNLAGTHGQPARTTVDTDTFARPSPRLHIPFLINDELRAVAKTTFNLFAHCHGSKSALDSRFDDLRKYVLEGPRLPRAPQNRDGVAYDARFVDPTYLSQSGLGARPWSDLHSIALFVHDAKLCGWVQLYGAHEYLVRLGRADDGDRRFYGHEFRADGSHNAEIDVGTARARRFGL